MPVKDADPQAQELTDAFAAAMNGPAKPREAATPPELDPDAPHGRNEAGEPNAPYGWTKAGKDGPSRPRKSPAGRRSKEDEPRTASTPQAGAQDTGKDKGKPAPDVPAQDFSEPLGELCDAIWMGLSGLSMIGPRIPVVGKFLGDGSKIAAEGYIWRSNRPQLVKTAQICADHNMAARARLAKLATGNATWVLMAGFTMMPFVAQTAAVLEGDKALAQMNPDASVARLAELNREAWDTAMDDLRAQAAAMAAQAQAEAMAGQPETNGQAAYAAV
jgi:hypothetical protein